MRVSERGCPFCGVARVLAATGVSLAMMVGCQKEPSATFDDGAGPVADSGVAAKAAPLVADSSADASESADTAASTDAAVDGEVGADSHPPPDAGAPAPKPTHVPRPPAPVYGGPPPLVPRPSTIYGGPPKPPAGIF